MMDEDGRFCWKLLAIITFLFSSVSIIYLFSFQRPLSNSSAQQQSSFASAGPGVLSVASHSQDLNQQHDAQEVSSNVNASAEDGYGGVLFRKAPWRAKIGNWLSSCYDHSSFIDVSETIFDAPCPNNCNGQGICNRELGQCRCFHGYAGLGCEEKLTLECNLDSSPEQPYGRFVVSICSAYCDKTKAMCFCGDGFKYPERPVAESCGFVVNGLVVNWTSPDWDNVYTNSSEKFGWCNVDAKDAYDGKVRFKEQCDCKYDCSWGRFCETPTQCVCINQCSGNGVCRSGFCQCKEGWYGVDCSVPSKDLSPLKWPSWMRPASIDIPDDSSLSEHISQRQAIKARIRRKHPLIYIYDLPSEFNSHLLEGRHWKYECVNRVYNNINATSWTEQLYGSEIALYESLLASPHRTNNGDEADFFYVPVLGACLITRADDAPHLNMQKFMFSRSYFNLDVHKRAYLHILQSYPYWNRTAGRDHIWFFPWDEGACYAPKEIWNSMMLVHWGNTNKKYNYSTTAYSPDNWDIIPLEERGSHPCFDPEKDLVLPAWKAPDPSLISARYWERPRNERTTLFYFNGNLGDAYENGRPESSYSMGIRQRLAEEFGSIPNKEGKLGRQATPGVVVTSLRSPYYAEELANSKFCGVLPGDGWSGRMEDSILHGCIPVIIQDGVQLLYESVLNYESFAVRIAEEDIPQLVQILKGFKELELDFKMANIQRIWQRFLYQNSIMLEAHRQQSWHGFNELWAKQFATLFEDDAFSTFIQVLHYKLYNDDWRLDMKSGPKSLGLPEQCKG